MSTAVKPCSACHEDKPQDDYSKKAWKARQIRRCRDCTTADRPVVPRPQPPPPPPPSIVKIPVGLYDAVVSADFSRRAIENHVRWAPCVAWAAAHPCRGATTCLVGWRRQRGRPRPTSSCVAGPRPTPRAVDAAGSPQTRHGRASAPTINGSHVGSSFKSV